MASAIVKPSVFRGGDDCAFRLRSRRPPSWRRRCCTTSVRRRAVTWLESPSACSCTFDLDSSAATLCRAVVADCVALAPLAESLTTAGVLVVPEIQLGLQRIQERRLAVTRRPGNRTLAREGVLTLLTQDGDGFLQLLRVRQRAAGLGDCQRRLNLAKRFVAAHAGRSARVVPGQRSVDHRIEVVQRLQYDRPRTTAPASPHRSARRRRACRCRPAA